ncbi:class I SAM-dependent methyltransferase [Polaromonas sp. SM01]|uniref:class I SAM-dependent methyltransferase n=1 Tax=Polaromonas sp. SM01 TaxID=3085630 RepID=UPI002981D84B|nr:class I SAM-dependent methyltransferase [Polaromonas sp. SM01]MDW5443273.1 class I SAM-dependent methyltransferase [Polaromonas sp. SM01]
MSNEIYEANRRSWNAATVAHNSHKGDQAAFFREGGSTLFPEELTLLGDVNGLRLLHLQCNAGQDSLSLARHGAQVTGVDISDEAIAFARRLSAEAALPASFERAEVVQWLGLAAAQGQRFDRVFASYGALCWLADLGAWARGIAGVLAPGGCFVLVEFHPFAMHLDENWQPRYDYFDKAPVGESGVGDYVADSLDGLAPDGDREGVQDFVNPHPSFEFFWGLGDVVTALASAGLAVEQLREYPYANGWRGFEGMRDIGGRRMAQSAGVARMPLMYGLSARQLSRP